jgi:hypothetical protein
MAIPAGPGARLVLIQTSFPLDSLKPGFNRPSHASNAHDFDELGACWGKDEVVGQLLGVVQTAPCQEPAVEAGLDEGGECGMTFTLF